MKINIQELDKKAADVNKAVAFAYSHRQMHRTEILNQADLEGLSMIDMLDAVRVES